MFHIPPALYLFNDHIQIIVRLGMNIGERQGEQTLYNGIPCSIRQ